MSEKDMSDAAAPLPVGPLAATLASLWQPIETAPKDGTKILRHHVIWGAMGVRHRRPDRELPFGMNWLSSDYSQMWPDESFTPHWLPLPDPPALNSGGPTGQAAPAAVSSNPDPTGE